MPMYKSSIRSLNERAPGTDAISGVASQYGDPLEQAAYLRGRMKAQEFIQQKQTTEANQNRLLAAQEESERRNAARETMAEQRFTQAQKDAAARAAFQEDQQARILDQQQWERKFNMEKATAAEERYREEAETAAAKLAKAEEVRIAKEQREEQEKSAIGEVTGAMLVAGMDVDGQTAKYLAYSYARANPEQRSGILKYIEDTAAYNEQTKEHKKQSAAYEALKASMANLNMENAGWFRPDGMIPHPFNQTVNVLRGYDKSGAAIIGQASESEAESNGWKILTRDPETKAVLIGGVPMPDAPKEPDFGGLLASDAAPVVPQTSPMAPPAVAPVAAPAATPAAAPVANAGVVRLSDPATAEAEFAALPSGTRFIGPDGKIRRKP